MALTTTTEPGIRLYNAFTGLSALERSQSGIARAEVVYYTVNATWPAAGSGNDRLFQTGNINLPKDFGYILTDANLVVKRPNAQDVYTEAAAQIRIYPGGILGPQINLVMPSAAGKQDANGTTAVGSIQSGAYNNIYPSINGDDGEMSYQLIVTGKH